VAVVMVVAEVAAAVATAAAAAAVVVVIVVVVKPGWILSQPHLTCNQVTERGTVMVN